MCGAVSAPLTATKSRLELSEPKVFSKHLLLQRRNNQDAFVDLEGALEIFVEELKKRQKAIEERIPLLERDENIDDSVYDRLAAQQELAVLRVHCLRTRRRRMMRAQNIRSSPFAVSMVTGSRRSG